MHNNLLDPFNGLKGSLDQMLPALHQYLYPHILRNQSPLHQLAEKMGVEMPICQSAYRVLYEAQPVESVVGNLMNRNKRREVDESWI